MRAPHDRFVRLTPDNRDGCELHWWPLIEPDKADMHQVGAINALAHIIRCQSERLAIAAIDSALFQGLIAIGQVDRLFSALPARYRHYRARIDARAMSGLETILRLMVLDVGLSCVPQVWFRDVGTVDLVVENCIVVETDGRQWHSGDGAASRDYARDAALTALELTVLRFNYQQVMFHPDEVMASILGALRAHRRS